MSMKGGEIMKKTLVKPAKNQPKVVLYQESLGGKCNCGCEHGA